MPTIDESQLDPINDSSPPRRTYGGGRIISLEELDPVAPQYTAGQKFLGGISKLVPFNLGDELAALAATAAKPTQSESFGARAILEGLGKGKEESQKPSFGQEFERNRQLVSDYQKEFSREHPYLGGTATGLGIFTAPIPNIGQGVGALEKGASTLQKIGSIAKKTGVVAGLGGASGALSGLGEGESGGRIQSALSGGKAGAIIGGALGLPLNAISVFAPEIKEAGKSLLRKSIGTRSTDYSKTAEDLGIWDIVDDAVQSNTKKAIDSLQKEGVLGDSVSAGKLKAASLSKQKELSGKISNLIDDFDATGKSITPSFSEAKNYINSGRVPARDANKFRKLLQNTEKAINEEGGGTLRYLQNQKIASGAVYEVGNDVANGFNRAIYRDLQKSIEKAVPEIRPLNRELTKFKIVDPILNRNLGAEEASSLVSNLTQKLRTSGGSITGPTLAGGALGGSVGAGAGLGLGTALSGLATRKGSKTLGDLLVKAGENPAAFYELASQAAQVAGRASGGTQGIYDSRETDSLINQFPKKSNRSIFNSEGIRARRINVPEQPKNTGLDFLLNAISKIESNNNPKAISNKGAKGMYQLTDATAKDYGVADPFNPLQARMGASKKLLDDFNYFKDPELTLAAYNWGRGNVDRALKKVSGNSWEDIRNTAPKETQNYVIKVGKEFNRLIQNEL